MLPFAILLLLICISLPSATAATVAATAPATPINLSKNDADSKWGPYLKSAAERALARAESRLGLTLDLPVEIYSQPDELAFERDLGRRVSHIVAVARPDRCQVVINRPAWFSQSPAAQEQTLTHEMTHLLLGRRVPGRLPAWLDEGLAMLVAGEDGWDSSWRVLVAGTFDTLIPIELLMSGMTHDPGRQALAYAQSLALTQYYLRRQFPETRGLDPAPLIQTLSDPAAGRRRVELLWDPIYLAALDYQWRQTYHTVWSFILFLSGSTFLWGAISLLFLVAWWRKRRLARAARERFANEENWDAEFGGAEPEWAITPEPEWDEEREEERDRESRS